MHRFIRDERGNGAFYLGLGVIGISVITGLVQLGLDARSAPGKGLQFSGNMAGCSRSVLNSRLGTAGCVDGVRSVNAGTITFVSADR